MLGADVNALLRRDATVHRLRLRRPGRLRGVDAAAVLLQAGKRAPGSAAAVDAFCSFDVVIEDRCDGGGPTGAAARPGRVHGAGGTGSWVTISPLGLLGPWAGLAGVGPNDRRIRRSAVLGDRCDVRAGFSQLKHGRQPGVLDRGARRSARHHAICLTWFAGLDRPVQIDGVGLGEVVVAGVVPSTVSPR